jgi:hypothetical protein
MKFNNSDHKLLVDSKLKELTTEIYKTVLPNLESGNMGHFSSIGEAVIALFEYTKNSSNKNNIYRNLLNYFDTDFKNEIVLILRRNNEEFNLTRKDICTVFRSYVAHYYIGLDQTNTKRYNILKEYIQESASVECLWYEGLSHAASPTQVFYRSRKSDTSCPFTDVFQTDKSKISLSIVESVLLSIWMDVSNILMSRPINNEKIILMFECGSNLIPVSTETYKKLMWQSLKHSNIFNLPHFFVSRVKASLEEEGYEVSEERNDGYDELYAEKHGERKLILQWKIDEIVFSSRGRSVV